MNSGQVIQRLCVGVSVLAISLNGTYAASAREHPSPVAVLAAIDGVAVVRLAVPSEPRPFQTVLALGDVAMTLDLKPHSSRAADFRVEVRSNGDESNDLDPGPIRTFRGTVLEIPGSHVGASLYRGALNALIRLPDDSVVEIEPLSKYLPEAEPDTYAVFNCARLPEPLDGGPAACGTTHTARLENTLAGPTGSLGVDNCAYLGICVADLICDSDWETYDAFGGDPQAVQAWIEFLVDWANSRFDELQITHHITQIVVRSDPQSDPYRVVSGPGPTDSQLLGSIYNEWNNPPTHTSDLIHLFYKGVLSVQVQGAAYEDGLCSTSNQTGMQSFSKGSTDANCPRAGTVIHELGHTWGSKHTLTGIMAYGTPNCDEPWDDAAPQIEQLRDALDSFCLDLQLTEADLAVSLSASSGGQTVTASVSNAGPEADPAVNLTIRFVSKGLYQITPIGSATGCVDLPTFPGGSTDRLLSCDLGEIASGGEDTLQWSVSPSPVGNPLLTVTATVSGELEDPDPNDNDDELSLGGQ